MFQRLTRANILLVLGLSLPLVGNVAVADPADGFCNGLDPSSGLFSTCIRAHSAADRVELLEGVGANEKAIARARLELDEALATYAGLPGGGIVPGFEAPPVPILAVAYINKDGQDGYDPVADTLIAKITDENGSGNVDAGDLITTNKYPTNFEAGEGDFLNTTHQVLYTNGVSQTADRVEVFTDCKGGYYTNSGGQDTESCDFLFKSGTLESDGCFLEEYSEQIYYGASFSQVNDFYGESCSDTNRNDSIRINVIQQGWVATTPSEPGASVNEFELNTEDNDFINVDININVESP